MKFVILLLLIFVSTITSSVARADCVLAPTAVCDGAPCPGETRPAGHIAYNVDANTYQYCGTDDKWYALRGFDPGGGGSGFLAFTDLADQPNSTLITSNILQVALGGPISVFGDGAPEYRICDDDTCSSVAQPWGSAAGTIGAGEFLQLRLTSDASYATPRTATATVSGTADHWTVITAGQDTTPDAFVFTDRTGVATATQIESDIIGILGIDAGTPTSISGGGAEYRICSDGASDANCDSSIVQNWTSGASTIDAGDYIQLRITSSASNNTMVSTTMTIGTGSDQWDVTTVGPDPCLGSPSPGDVCADGSNYIGQVGGNDVYATASASQISDSWNNGSTNFTETGFTSTTDGPGNTAGLVALVDAGSPYDAAVYCNGLTNVHGHSDWYLPAKDELNLFWNGGSPLAGVLADGTWYWSSTESNTNFAWLQRFNNGAQTSGGKLAARAVRCVRR